MYYIYINLVDTKCAIEIKLKERIIFSINGAGAIIYLYGVI